jgi:hypothetical protein
MAKEKAARAVLAGGMCFEATTASGHRVVRLLGQLIHWHGAPKRIALDK